MITGATHNIVTSTFKIMTIQRSIITSLLLAISAAFLSAGELAKHVGFLPEGPEITKKDVMSAQEAWGDAVVKIGKADSDEAYKLAKKIAASAYAFDLGPIMFKPTLAAETPFRPDLEGSVSYFVSGNEKYAEDKGFALKPWSNVRFDNHTVKFFENIAIAMGHYYFTGPDGKETKVEYTKGYVKLPDERVLIFLQDSSMPYGS